MTRQEQVLDLVSRMHPQAQTSRLIALELHITTDAAYQYGKQLVKKGELRYADGEFSMARPPAAAKATAKRGDGPWGRQKAGSYIRLRSKSRRSGKVVVILDLKHPDATQPKQDGLPWAVIVEGSKEIYYAKSAPEAWVKARSL